MRYAETIVVGGGPAGSTAAGALVAAGHEVLVLDKAAFPRLKLCAGWITEKVMQDLEFTAADYPHPILPLEMRSRIGRLPLSLSWFPTPGANFSIRRIEFDAWLLERSGAPVVTHAVKSIRRDGDRYILDDAFACRNLIGAGGTQCPVRRALFPAGRDKSRLIATLEKEFEYPARGERCHLTFFRRGLEGYAWVVPKGDGFVNIGLGGTSAYFKRSSTNIHDHFKVFLADLVAEGTLDRLTADGLKETGHPYYLFSHDGAVKQDRCYLIGDSAGLATVDLGEGIGPAVESGLMAAGEILGTAVYDKERISQYSFGGIIRRLLERANRRKRRAARRTSDGAASLPAPE